MRIIVTLLIFVITFVVAGDGYAQRAKDQKCLSYWAVGASGECRRAVKTVKPVPQQPSPTIVYVQQPPQQPSPVVVEKELTEKEKLNVQVEKEVDDFLENHGKPPREFARFMINPTLENALVWAQKYNDMLKRTEETTVAWMKAQHVLKEKEAGNLNTEIPTLANKRRVVPSYGLEWSAEAGSFTSDEPKETVGSLSENAEYVSSGGSLTPPPPPEPEVVQNRYTQRPQQPSATGAPKTKDEQMVDMFKLMQKMKQEEQNSIKSDKKADIPAPGGDLTKLLPNAEGSQDGKIHVSYYFSAECPYCKKFEVGFQQIIKELGSKIVVECVDMTPSAKDIVNIYGKVDCDWRPLQSGEMAKFAIKSTPTLLVQFPNKAGPERLEGNVSASNLRTYLRL